MHDIRRIREAPEAFDAAMARRGVAGNRQPSAGDRRHPPQHHPGTAGEAGPPQRAGAGDRPGQAQRRRQHRAGSGGASACATTWRRWNSEAEDPGRSAGRAPWRRCPMSSTPRCPKAATNRPTSCCTSTASRRGPNFTPKQHFELGEALGLMDFAGAAKLAGARFTVLKRRAGAAGTRARASGCSTCTRSSTATPRPPCRCW